MRKIPMRRPGALARPLARLLGACALAAGALAAVAAPPASAASTCTVAYSQGPALVTDWVGDPTPYGAVYQAHLVVLAGG